MHRFRWLPNAVSVLRILLIAPYVWLFLKHGNRGLLFAITLFIVFTDWIDGLLARKFHSESKAGEVLDALGDAIFIFTSWILLYGEGIFSFPVMGALFVPRLITGCSMLLYRGLFKKWNTKHYLGGKIATVCYFALIGWLLLELPYGEIAVGTTLTIGYVGSFSSEFQRYRA